MEPRDFLEAGIELIAKGTPAMVRTGVSRLYFANHLYAVAQASRRQGYEPTHDGGDHGGILGHLKKRGGRMRALHAKLDKLRDARGHADYHLSPNEGDLSAMCPYCETNAEFGFSAEEIEALEDDAKSLFGALSQL